MVIYLWIIFGVYFLFLLAGINKLLFSSFSKKSDFVFSGYVSVIVPVRNEEELLQSFLDSIDSQSFSPERFEVILVNDHSEDDSRLILEEWIKKAHPFQIKMIDSIGAGKKNALTEGIQQARGEIILTTDADCRLPHNWIQAMAESFDESSTMIIGLVKIQSDRSLFSKLQSIEFASLIGTGIVMSELGHPILCNGASLAFRKSSFEDVKGYTGNLNIPSGDDEFLMRKLLKKFPGTVKVIQEPVVVTTAPQSTIRNFIHQRIRWAGKWKVNDLMLNKFVAIFVFMVQISTVIALIYVFVHPEIISAMLICKILLEGCFLFLVSKRIKQSFYVFSFLLVELLYPFYVIAVALVSQVADFEWKNRKLKSVG